MYLKIGSTLKIINLLKTRVLAMFIHPRYRSYGHSFTILSELAHKSFLLFVSPLQRSIRTRHFCTNTAPLTQSFRLSRLFGNGFSAGYFSILVAAVIKRARAPSGNADARRSAHSRTRHAIEYGRPILGVIYWSCSAR